MTCITLAKNRQPAARRVTLGGRAAALVLTCALTTTAVARDDRMMPVPAPAQPGAITLDTGQLAGATAPESWHRQYNSVFARNVTVATLTPFLPSALKATGAAVIVAPGGGFRTLSMENEGWAVASALADKGVAAKRPVEFHLYEQDGHGFGMYQKTTTSTGWFDGFTRWLDMRGYLKPR